MPKLRKPRYALYPKLFLSEYFIPNFKHKNIVYVKLNTPIYTIRTMAGPEEKGWEITLMLDVPRL